MYNKYLKYKSKYIKLSKNNRNNRNNEGIDLNPTQDIDQIEFKEDSIQIKKNTTNLIDKSVCLSKIVSNDFQQNLNQKPLAICKGKRNGVSGCRDCCKKNFNDINMYEKCVFICMNE